jgi:hypothetical protein
MVDIENKLMRYQTFSLLPPGSGTFCIRLNQYYISLNAAVGAHFPLLRHPLGIGRRAFQPRRLQHMG